MERGEYTVCDPSFDQRPVEKLVAEYAWMRERVVQISQALLAVGRPLSPAACYLGLLGIVDPHGH